MNQSIMNKSKYMMQIYVVIKDNKAQIKEEWELYLDGGFYNWENSFSEVEKYYSDNGFTILTLAEFCSRQKKIFRYKNFEFNNINEIVKWIKEQHLSAAKDEFIYNLVGKNIAASKKTYGIEFTRDVKNIELDIEEIIC